MHIEAFQSPVLSHFLGTRSFQGIYAEALADSMDPRTVGGISLGDRYYTELAGTVFEAVAYEYLRSLPEHAGILSPDETFEYIRDTYFPNSPVSQHRFGRKNVFNKFTPDGLYERDGEPLRTFEYTTLRRGLGKYCGEKIGSCSRFIRDTGVNTQLTFVVLEGTEIPDKILVHPIVTEPIAVPVNGTQFGSMVRWLNTTYRPSTFARTLQETRQDTQAAVEDWRLKMDHYGLGLSDLAAMLRVEEGTTPEAMLAMYGLTLEAAEYLTWELSRQYYENTQPDLT